MPCPWRLSAPPLLLASVLVANQSGSASAEDVIFSGLPAAETLSLKIRRVLRSRVFGVLVQGNGSKKSPI